MGAKLNINLFIIGVEKAGTTALFRHIAQAPIVHAHMQSEMFYFLSDDEFQKGPEYALEKYFQGHEKKYVVAKSVMQINSPDAMLRLKKECPDVKCIIMLREPAARAYSAYNYAVMRGAENCATFEEALALEDERLKKDSKPNNPLLYISNSTYAPKIKTALDIFGADNVLIIYHEEYKRDPRKQLARIEAFTGENLFENVNFNFASHNRAAKAKYPWLARLSYRFFESRAPIKRFFRALLPHDKANKIRHALMNFNRVELPYRPMNAATALKIRTKLTTDRDDLIKLIGYCPWEGTGIIEQNETNS